MAPVNWAECSSQLRRMLYPPPSARRPFPSGYCRVPLYLSFSLHRSARLPDNTLSFFLKIVTVAGPQYHLNWWGAKLMGSPMGMVPWAIIASSGPTPGGNSFGTAHAKFGYGFDSPLQIQSPRHFIEWYDLFTSNKIRFGNFLRVTSRFFFQKATIEYV